LIKKEARILGLSAPTGKLKQTPVVGVVFRGNLWLDGILVCQIQPDRPDCLSTLVRAIVQSRQYSQIHAVILSREKLVSGIRTDILGLSRKINLPVVSISRETAQQRTNSHQNERPSSRSKVEYFSVKVAGASVCLKTAGISPQEAREIFVVACANGRRIPEAVRVADLVAKHAGRRSLFSEAK
jgi:endonuclease V-like protein UPF0215 family